MERNSHYANFRRLSNLVRFRSFTILPQMSSILHMYREQPVLSRQLLKITDL